MPQVFKVGSYWVYFWSNENEPIEPIHVHVASMKMAMFVLPEIRSR